MHSDWRAAQDHRHVRMMGTYGELSTGKELLLPES